MEAEAFLKQTPPALADEAEPSSQQPPLVPENGDEPSPEQQLAPSMVEVSGAVRECQSCTPVTETGATMTIGHEFETAEAALAWYNDYAKKVGFSTKISNSRKNSSGVVSWKSFACSKEGKTNESYRKKHKDAFERGIERRRIETRCRCQARMNISRKQTGDGWTVTLFEGRHNHDLATPSKVHMLRSHRKVSAAKKNLVQESPDANIPTYTLMLNDVEGSSSMDGSDKDIYNYEGALKAVIDRCDAQSTIHYFETQKEKNDDFFYCYDTASDSTLTRYFWADSDSRNSYAFFGDVVVFCTTSNTNKYGWYLATFVGVNHHRQTTVFGCGLISKQTTESFVWLFSKFVEAMTLHARPGVIITHQDTAITLAVAQVFPDTAHYHCLWHILEKFPSKINVALHEHLHRDLVEIIMESKTPEEFDRRWTEKTMLPELVENTWFSEIYSIRDKWVPAYVKPVFSAGMLNNQGVESNHSIFNNYVDKKCSLNEVVTRITRVVVHQRRRELEANHHDLNETPSTSTEYEMEKQMAEKFTKTVFQLFQLEFVQCARYTCHHVESTDDTQTYVVRRFARPGETVERERELTYNIPSDRVFCSCRMFEFDGIPCRHMLCWMRLQQVMMMPEQYILRRWTKSAKSDPLYAPAAYVFSRESLHSRRTALKQLAMDVVDDASLSVARSNYLSSLLKSAKLSVNGMDDGCASG